MKIGIDASRYNISQATGIEEYSNQIINSLMPLILENKDNSLVLYSREDLKMKKMARVENKVLSARRLWTIWRFSQYLWRHKPDVLFVPSHVLPFNAPKSSVVTIHDVAFRYLRNSYSFFQYHYLDWSTRRATLKAEKIIVPSEATKRDLIKFYNCPKEKIEVIYHGVRAPQRVEKKEDLVGAPYIFFVGRLESKKNLERLIMAFSRFQQNHPEFKLVLAGKRGQGFFEIWKTVEEEGLIDQIVMPGYVTEEEKYTLYKNCAMFAFPSLYEGFGFPVLEAFYHKKPVLAAKVSSLPEVCGEAALFVDPYDAESIEMGMEKIVNDPDYAQDLVKKGTERLKEFKWSTCAKKTYAVLKKAVK
jgi:glycosyltransferase involved in cell wall biosynthesis